jgi:zinc transporter ZupT
MFAAVKMIVAMGLALGAMIASIVETPYPRFAACFWVAFAVGVMLAESMHARRQRSVRYLTRKAQAVRFPHTA